MANKNKKKNTIGCKKCSRLITKTQNKIQCAGECEGWYHKDCSGLTDKEFKEQESKRSSEKWICDNCSGSDSENEEDERSEEEDSDNDVISHKANKIRKSYHFDFEAVLEHPKPSNREILGAMKGMFEELKKSLSFNSQMIEDLTENLKRMGKENKHLKKEQSLLKDRVSDLEREIIHLKASPSIEKEEERSKNIVVMGIKSGPDVKRDIEKIITKLNIQVSEVEFEVKQLSGQGERKPVLVSFSKRSDKEKIFEKRRTIPLDTVTCGIDSNNPAKIFLNEDLPKHTRELFKKARDLKKYGFKYVWCKGGKIFVRKGENDSIKSIIISAQITNLINTN